MKISYDRWKTKHITVATDIAFIEVKLKAHRDEWFNLWKRLDDHPITFETVTPFLSKRTSKKTMEALRLTFLEHPTICEVGFFSAVIASCRVNPLFKPARKTRNPGEYRLSWTEKNTITTQAVHLYSCLKQLAEIPKRCWPKHIKALLDGYGVEEPDLCSRPAIKRTVAAALSEFYGLGNEPGDYPDRFWKTFVTELKPRFLELPLPGPADPVLGDLFTKTNI
jgi:hypothetical protein